MSKTMRFAAGNTKAGVKNGLGFVEAMFEALLDEQARFVKGLEAKPLADLPPRTKEEEAAMAWDEGLMQ